MCGRKFIVNTSFKVFDCVTSPASCIVVSKFSLDAGASDIRKKDCIEGLSWLTENGFLDDTQECRLRHAISRLVIPCSVTSIPSVTISNW